MTLGFWEQGNDQKVMTLGLGGKLGSIVLWVG